MDEEPRAARRAFSPREKLEVLLEGATTGNVAEVCRRHGVRVSMYYRWRTLLFKHAGTVFAHGNGGAGQRQVAVLEEQLRRKNAVIAELTQENLDLKRGRWH
jgi:transposase-like protein